VDKHLLASWQQAKSSGAFASLQCDAEQLIHVLAPRRFAIIQHFMAYPNATLAERAFALDCPPARLQKEIEALVGAGMLEAGLFGLMAAVELRDPGQVEETGPKQA